MAKPITVTKELVQICEDLFKHEGLIKPEALVEQARDPNSPIHHLFEWNDSDAADKYRIHQARQYISHVRIRFVGEQRAPAYVNVRITMADGSHERGYAPLMHVMNNEELKQQALGRALQDLRTWETKYKNLEEISKIVNWDEVEKLDIEL